MLGSKRLASRLRSEPHAALALCLFLVAAYVSLANLGYVGLWGDEVLVAFPARNLLLQGDILGWDGRNLVAGPNGVHLNEDLRDVGPPLQYLLTAAGFAIFGVNEAGARVLHALAGLLALGFFYLVLRQHLPDHPRLRLFIFAFGALSTQLLMYFRHARYYGVAVLCLMALFYCYERYWRSGRAAWLAAVTLISAAAFFNHYAAGTATMLSLAAWHLVFRARQTTRQQWLAFGACGVLVGALGLAYLLFIGLVGAGRDPTASFLTADWGVYSGTVPLPLFRLWFCARDLFRADWISWPVCLWFAAMLVIVWRRRRRGRSSPPRHPRRIRRLQREQPALHEAASDGLPWLPVGRILLMGALFAAISAVVSVQPIWLPGITLDLRYYVPALPLLLAMKGLFAEWTWRKSKAAGSVVGALLLLTSLGAAPFNIPSEFSWKPTLGSHPYLFLREIHRPYRDVVQVTSDYLRQHAAQDDIVFVAEPVLRDELTFYLTHLLRFCAVLDENSVLPRDKLESLGLPPRIWGCSPDWIVVPGPVPPACWEGIEPHYDIVTVLDVYPITTQRAELNRHEFEPLPAQVGVQVFRRKQGLGAIQSALTGCR